MPPERRPLALIRQVLYEADSRCICRWLFSTHSAGLRYTESGGIFYWFFTGGFAIIQSLLGQNLRANAAGVGPPLKSSKPSRFVGEGKSEVSSQPPLSM